MRQLKTFDQIFTLMIREVRQYEHLSDLQPQLVALPERDASGCNWAVVGWATSLGVERAPDAHLMALVKAWQVQFNAVGKSPGNATAVLFPVVANATQMGTSQKSQNMVR